MNVTRKTDWLFDVPKNPRTKKNELGLLRAKRFIYESLRRSVSRHDMQEGLLLLKLLPQDTTLDPYLLFRFVMILIESGDRPVNKNVIIYLESLLSKLDLSKRDVFVEFLAYFIRHNRIDDARELFAQRYRSMQDLKHRILPHVDVNLQCYGFLLNYLDWSASFSPLHSNNHLDVSIQGWLVNAMDCLGSAELNYEYFVMCLIRVLLTYGFTKKAYLFSSKFQRNNPDNISAQLIHLHLIDRVSTTDAGSDNSNTRAASSDDGRSQKRLDDLAAMNNFSVNMEEESIHLEDYPIDYDREDILQNLRRLDPGREELLELANVNDNLIDTLKDLMDGLETLSEIKNIKRWESLQKLLENILENEDKALITDARFVWRTRYQRFWSSIDFVDLIGSEIQQDLRELIEKVTEKLDTTLDEPVM